MPYFVQPNSGSVKAVTLTTPAAGAEISLTVPAGQEWIIIGGTVKLVTSAVAATRAPVLVIADASGSVIFTSPLSTQAASLTQTTNLAVQCPTVAVASGVAVQGIPDLALPAGCTIKTVTALKDTGDQYSVALFAQVVTEN